MVRRVPRPGLAEAGLVLLAAGPGGSEPGTDGAEPTNWASAFSGSAWEYDERSGEYYLHAFSPKQPDLNWENPEVREAVYAMMNWWVDRGVDGFRMDVINMISKEPEMLDRRPIRSPGRRYARGERFFVNGPAAGGVPGRDEWRGRRWTERNLLTVGEMPGSTIELPAESPTRPGASSTWSSPSSTSTWTAMPGGQQVGPRRPALPALKQNLADWQVGLADVGWNSLYWDNHDQPRAVSRFGDDCPEHRVNSAKTLATVQHMHQGTPYVYQGEELGMTNTYFAEIGHYRDIESVNYHADALSLGLEAGGGPELAVGQEPGQRAYADAMGRHLARRVHRRDPVAAGQPQLRDDQRRRGS